jgi:hypothetical protein
MSEKPMEKELSNVRLFDGEEALAWWIDRIQPDIIVGDPVCQNMLDPVLFL